MGDRLWSGACVCVCVWGGFDDSGLKIILYYEEFITYVLKGGITRDKKKRGLYY